LTVDTGVYLKLSSDITFGMKEVFSLNRDKVHVKMIDNTNYKYNNTVWGDVSGNVEVYKPIVFNSAAGLKIESSLNSTGVDKTKSITLKSVRGYNVGTVSDNSVGADYISSINNVDDLSNNRAHRNIIINRYPATYTFTLDASFANPTIELAELYDGSAVYIDMSSNYTSEGKSFPRPINRYDASWNNINNWLNGIDVCNNNLSLTPYHRFERSKLTIYRYQFSNGPENGKDFNDVRVSPLDSTLNMKTIDTKTYSFARSGSVENSSGPFTLTNIPEDGESASAYYPTDLALAARDGSYNYTYERQIYKQTYIRGNGVFDTTDLVSTLAISGVSNDRWKNNYVETSGDHIGKVKLDIGLKFNVKQSVLASDTPRHYNLNVVASQYKYSFKNSKCSSSVILPLL
jgi:hypothetical protein